MKRGGKDFFSYCLVQTGAVKLFTEVIRSGNKQEAKFIEPCCTKLALERGKHLLWEN